MHIYKVIWYNEDEYGMTDYTSIIFSSVRNFNSADMVKKGFYWLTEEQPDVDISDYSKVSSVEINTPVISYTLHGGILA